MKETEATERIKDEQVEKMNIKDYKPKKVQLEKETEADEDEEEVEKSKDTTPTLSVGASAADLEFSDGTNVYKLVGENLWSCVAAFDIFKKILDGKVEYDQETSSFKPIKKEDE